MHLSIAHHSGVCQVVGAAVSCSPRSVALPSGQSPGGLTLHQGAGKRGVLHSAPSGADAGPCKWDGHSERGKGGDEDDDPTEEDRGKDASTGLV